jgi:hypothetical protein
MAVAGCWRQVRPPSSLQISFPPQVDGGYHVLMRAPMVGFAGAVMGVAGQAEQAIFDQAKAAGELVAIANSGLDGRG